MYPRESGGWDRRNQPVICDREWRHNSHLEFIEEFGCGIRTLAPEDAQTGEVKSEQSEARGDVLTVDLLTVSVLQGRTQRNRSTPDVILLTIMVNRTSYGM